MKESTKKRIFVWIATLSITIPFDFSILNNVNWNKPWHERAFSIVIVVFFFRITGVIYERFISPILQKN